MFCPICGHADEATEWNTTEQAEYIKTVALRHVKERIGDDIRHDAQTLNRTHARGGFISMSLEYKTGPRTYIVPVVAYDELNQFYECGNCGCHYSSTGPAFFCPACGANSAESRFEGSMTASIRLMENIETIGHQIRESFDAAAAENTMHLLVETTFANLVAAFQSFAESVYLRCPGSDAGQPVRNAFQNLDRSNELWLAAVGSSYEDLIDPPKYALISIFFQRRHLLVHRDGIVDARYLELSDDISYQATERIVTTPNDAIQFARLLLELSRRIIELAPPTQTSEDNG